MKNVYISSGQIISSLGFTTDENFKQIENGKSGIKSINDRMYSPAPFFASCIDNDKLNNHFDLLGSENQFTRLEKLMILSIEESLKNTGIDLKNNQTLLILTTTKGNIDVLENRNKPFFETKRAYLSELAFVIQKYFKAAVNPLVVCNACISGVAGIITAARLIRGNKYKNIVVTGGDIVSAFTVAGFQSFKAIGSTPCKPYDIARDGLSLGEGVATVFVSSDKNSTNQKVKIKIEGGSITNDANHISGPSRNGEGLFNAIDMACEESELVSESIDFISAHGTATAFNDEMECKALNAAALQNVPVNSFKGAIGHTLGAAGVIESVLTIESMINNRLMPTIGFLSSGVSQPLNVVAKPTEKNIHYALKTASGFGGCNAAIIFQKSDD